MPADGRAGAPRLHAIGRFDDQECPARLHGGPERLDRALSVRHDGEQRASRDHMGLRGQGFEDTGGTEAGGRIEASSEPLRRPDHPRIAVQADGPIPPCRRQSRDQARPGAEVQPVAPLARRELRHRAYMEVAIERRSLEPREQDDRRLEHRSAVSGSGRMVHPRLATRGPAARGPSQACLPAPGSTGGRAAAHPRIPALGFTAPAKPAWLRMNVPSGPWLTPSPQWTTRGSCRGRAASRIRPSPQVFGVQCRPGVLRMIRSSSSVMSGVMSLNSGVLR